MNHLRPFRVSYEFNNEPRQHLLEIDQPQLTAAGAAMHLLQLHFGDGENSLILPSADAAPVEVLRQAQLLGITSIDVAPEADDQH